MAGKFKISVTGMPVAYGYLDGRADYCLLRDFETWSIISIGSIIRNARVATVPPTRTFTTYGVT